MGGRGRRRLYLVLDQVDEYFLYHGWHGGPLLDALPELVTRPGCA